jgi:putative MATE family efflux protein
MLRLLNTPESIIDWCADYLYILFYGVIGLAFYNILSGILRGLGDSFSALLYLLIACILNIGLDIFFVASLGLGVAGVALATLLSQALSAALAVPALHKHNSTLRLRAGSLRIDPEVLHQVLRIGLPAGLQALVITVSNVIVQYYINAFGETDVAAFATYYKVENFIYLPIMAFGQAATTFAGQNTGAGQLRRVRRGSNITLLMCIAATVCVSGLILQFPETVFGWFMKDSEVVKSAVLIAFVSFPFYWLYAFLEVYGGALRGMGNAIGPMVIIISNVCVLRIALLAVFSRTIGTLASIAAVYPITWGGAALCFLAAFRLAMRKSSVPERS